MRVEIYFDYHSIDTDSNVVGCMETFTGNRIKMKSYVRAMKKNGCRNIDVVKKG